VLVNAGSSSLKCSLMESADRTVLAHIQADWVEALLPDVPHLAVRRGVGRRTRASS
jgi:acetate kinase